MARQEPPGWVSLARKGISEAHSISEAHKRRIRHSYPFPLSEGHGHTPTSQEVVARVSLFSKAASMTYDRRLLPTWAEDAVLDSLAGQGPDSWTEERMEALFEWAWRAIVAKRMLDRVRDGELWIEDFHDGEPVFSERNPHPVGLRLVPKP